MKDKFDLIESHISYIRENMEDTREVMTELFSNSRAYANYVIALRSQIRDLGADPLPFPDELLQE
jgi:hypothetical protein